MGKRKSSALAQDFPRSHQLGSGRLVPEDPTPKAKRRASGRKAAQAITDPDLNKDILDGQQALRASPDADTRDVLPGSGRVLSDGDRTVKNEFEKDLDRVPSLVNGGESESSLSDISNASEPSKKKPAKPAKETKKLADKVAKVTPKEAEERFLDPEADGDEEVAEEEIQAALSRPPPVNSDYLPLPWKGRLGYACLCTYLRFSNPPVFSSRTCRIASILENRHPLMFPDQPPHPTKNRPDKGQPASVQRGQRFVESLGLANAKDIVKMLRWNHRYGIRFMRLSSEMFPFASHEEHGYKLATFAAETLAGVGQVAAELGHRLTTHPGQYTQLGSLRQVVIDSAIRDLEYHCEMLDLLKLPPQQNRDAVMILHLGGTFGDKAATIERFKGNYARLPQGIKNRLVLENDDVCYSVHDLLPLCEELNIPMVLDFHHHNIIFDPLQIREGTKDITDLFPRILATWKRKNITPKMHYSEPTPQAITKMQRRKHSPRVATLPPCPPDMDLMIEAKDKEQAVFELMRTFKLPGYNSFNDILPYTRDDDNKPTKIPKNKPPSKRKTNKGDENPEETSGAVAEDEDSVQRDIPEEEVGMGGPEGRVYWPPGMEEWLRPKKRILKNKASGNGGENSETTPAKTKNKGKKAAADAAADATELAAKLAADKGDGKGDASMTDGSATISTPAKTPRARGGAKKAEAVAGKKRGKKE